MCWGEVKALVRRQLMQPTEKPLSPLGLQAREIFSSIATYGPGRQGIWSPLFYERVRSNASSLASGGNSGDYFDMV